jgi:hypothetical protein
MLRYKSVDFRKSQNSECNRMTNPLLMSMHNGVSLDALEVMFIKFKARFVTEGWDHVCAPCTEVLGVCRRWGGC